MYHTKHVGVDQRIRYQLAPGIVLTGKVIGVEPWSDRLRVYADEGWIDMISRENVVEVLDPPDLEPPSWMV